MSKPNIILIPIGSAGDVHPFIAIGRELKRRGHAVTVLTNDYFKTLTEKAGLEFVASASMANFEETLKDPRLWDPIRGFEFIARQGFLPIIATVYEFIRQRYVPGETLVVGSSFAWGARIAQEKLGVPLVTLHLQPSVIMSLKETPTYAGMSWVPRLPLFLKKGYFKIIARVTDGVVAPELNAFRKTLGLGPVRRILSEWSHSPLKTIGLFPGWFAPPQTDWPPHTSLTSFPLNDADDIYGVPPEVETFLESGPPPVVFTAGSAMQQASQLFKVSAEVCRQIGCRGILVNAFDDQHPPILPAGVISVKYVPFQWLFSRAATVVHHGGIGTTAQALAAGVPQLVTPFAHDQFDNAARVVQLGVGEQIAPNRYSVQAVSEKIRRLMEDPALRTRAREISTCLSGYNAIAQTCDLLLKYPS